MTDAERTSAQAEEQDKKTGSGGLLSKIKETAKNVVETVTETAKEVVEGVAERTPPVVASAASTAKDTASAVVEKVRGTSHGESVEGTETSPSDASGDEQPTADVLQAEAEAPVAEQPSAEAPQAESTVDVEQPAAEVPQADAAAEADQPAAEVVQETAEEAPQPEAVVEQSSEETPQSEAVAEQPSEQTPQAEATGEGSSGDAGVISDTVAAVASVADTVRKRVARVYGTVIGSEQASPAASGDQVAAPAEQEAGASYQAPAEGGKGGRPRRFKDVQAGMQLQGKVTSIALYGIFVDVGVGRDGLVHISEMSDKRIESPTDLVQIGTQVDVWVKSVDPDARRISLTMRDPNRARPERPERRAPRKREVDRERLAEMKVGDSVEGVISSLAPFGAFVDLGVGKDGLVHVSELAEGRVERPEDAVQVGERYTFKILEVDPEGNRISLSLRRAQRVQRMNQLEPGVTMDGTISGIAPFGAFVDIGVGRDGLVHVSEISADRINSVEEAVKVGDKVQVKVLEVDPNSKRISLTMRVDEPMPNERERQAPRPSAGPGFRGDALSAPPAPSFPTAPAFGGPPPLDEGRGDRRGRRGSGREGGRETGGRDMGRGEGRSGAGGRRDRPERGGGRPSGGRDSGRGGHREGQVFETSEEVYTFEDPEEETFTGDATLEDLLSKFNSGKGRDRRNARDDDDDEETRGQRRADAIRRTLALRDED
jgi:small subunit ribosomal protein S1